MTTVQFVLILPAGKVRIMLFCEHCAETTTNLCSLIFHYLFCFSMEFTYHYLFSRRWPFPELQLECDVSESPGSRPFLYLIFVRDSNSALNAARRVIASDLGHPKCPVPQNCKTLFRYWKTQLFSGKCFHLKIENSEHFQIQQFPIFAKCFLILAIFSVTENQF